MTIVHRAQDLDHAYRTTRAQDLENHKVLLPASHPEARPVPEPQHYASARDYARAIGAQVSPPWNRCSKVIKSRGSSSCIKRRNDTKLRFPG